MLLAAGHLGALGIGTIGCVNILVARCFCNKPWHCHYYYSKITCKISRCLRVNYVKRFRKSYGGHIWFHNFVWWQVCHRAQCGLQSCREELVLYCRVLLLSVAVLQL